MKKISVLVKKIPLVGPALIKVYRKIKGLPTFTTSKNYWEDRYKLGGNSGSGSYNNLAEFKGEVINQIVNHHNVETVIEFGSGDGNQLDFFQFKSYLGFDVSQKAIDLCNEKFRSDNSKSFKNMNLYQNNMADLTMSLDVIYHLVEDDVFSEYMEILFKSSKNLVIVYSSNTNDQLNNQNTSHVRHRKFTDWVEKNITDFKLIEFIPNKYPFNGDEARTSFADFYIYQKI